MNKNLKIFPLVFHKKSALHFANFLNFRNFFQGLDPTIRIDVWKFLLQYYSWDSTYKQRAEHRERRVYVQATAVDTILVCVGVKLVPRVLCPILRNCV